MKNPETEISPPKIEREFEADGKYWVEVAGLIFRAGISETYTGLPEWDKDEDGNPVVIIPSVMD